MSFALTTPQIISRKKTVTRRLGWKNLRPGTLLLAVQQARGLKVGEIYRPLAVIRVERVSTQALNIIGDQDVMREGFPWLSDVEFIRHFCAAMGCAPHAQVTRIEFSYLPGGRFFYPGVCRKCGCTSSHACEHPDFGACWWVEPDLCSHCSPISGVDQAECEHPFDSLPKSGDKWKNRNPRGE